MRNVLRGLIILLSLFFLFGLAYLGLFFPGVFIIAVIDIFLFLMTGKKEEVNALTKKAGKYCKDRAEILGVLGREGADVAAKLGVEAAKTAGKLVKSVYQEIGGRDGAEEAIKELAKGAEEVGKLAATGVIELGRAGAHVVKDATRQIEAIRQENEAKKPENAAYRILTSGQMDDED